MNKIFLLIFEGIFIYPLLFIFFQYIVNKKWKFPIGLGAQLKLAFYHKLSKEGWLFVGKMFLLLAWLVGFIHLLVEMVLARPDISRNILLAIQAAMTFFIMLGLLKRIRVKEIFNLLLTRAIFIAGLLFLGDAPTIMVSGLWLLLMASIIIYERILISAARASSGQRLFIELTVMTNLTVLITQFSQGSLSSVIFLVVPAIALYNVIQDEFFLNKITDYEVPGQFQ